MKDVDPNYDPQKDSPDHQQRTESKRTSTKPVMASIDLEVARAGQRVSFKNPQASSKQDIDGFLQKGDIFGGKESVSLDLNEEQMVRQRKSH